MGVPVSSSSARTRLCGLRTREPGSRETRSVGQASRPVVCVPYRLLRSVCLRSDGRGRALRLELSTTRRCVLWIPPELRENCGEIEAAAEGRLPELVELAHIRGDLHMHTTETDGRASLDEMAEAARARGYQYISITDHSKALAMANGLDEKRVVAFARQVKEINRDGALGLRLFSGIECDRSEEHTSELGTRALAARP